METRIPNSIAVTKESDLEKLIPGDCFQISFLGDRVGNFVTYEGECEGKLAVMIQDGQDLDRILSIRINKHNMIFSGRKYIGCAEVTVSLIKDEDIVFYNPSHHDYKKKKQLFHATYRWQEKEF